MGFFSQIKEKFVGKSAKQNEKYVAGLDRSNSTFSDRINELAARFREINDEYFEELENILIMSDVGVSMVMKIVEEIKNEVRLQNITDPKEINEIIRELAKDDDNIYLVNTEEEFNRKSPFGIPGRELLLEHVHPTIEGHRVIANCFLEVLRQNQSCFYNKKLQIGTSEYLYNFPVLEFDSLAGEYACLQLRKGFPFYEKDLSTITPKTEVEKIAANYVRQKNWYQSMDQLYQYALNSKNEKLCLDILRVRITDNPYDLTFLGQGGEFAEIRKEYPLAIFFYTRSFRLYPTVQTAQNLVAIHLRLDQPDLALPYIEYILRNGNPKFNGLKELCHKIIQYKQELNWQSNDSIRQAIRSIYLQMGNQDAADLYN